MILAPCCVLKRKEKDTDLNYNLENRLVILLVCIILALVLIIATVDTGCYFTRRRGALNAIINSRVNGAKGAQTLNSEHSSSEDGETQRELSPLNE